MVRMFCAADLRLSAILPDAELCGGPDVRLASCTSDARHVRPGDIFVPLVEADRDGHFDVALAVSRGAVAVVAERLLPVAIPVYIVDDTREALGRLCHQVVSAPSHRLCTLGVTGTHGKTTTAMLLAAILRAAGGPAGWATSLGWSSGQGRHAGSSLRWSAPELARRLAGMEAAGCTAAVLELDSATLAERRSAGLALDAAIVTNLRPGGDLRLHGNRDNYRRASLRILDHLKPEGLAVVNADDPASASFQHDLPCQVLTFGLEQHADVTGHVVERFVSEQTFMLSAGQETVPVRTRVVGDQHVANCLAATAVGLALGIDLTTIVRGLEAVESLPGRLERLECGQPFGVFIDGAASVEQLAGALRALRPVTRGRLICVYGPDGRGPAAERPLYGRLVERLADYGIVTTNNPGSEPGTRITDDVVDGYRRPAQAHVIPDRRRAVAYALSIARPGDTVLVAGKGERQGQWIGNQQHAFDDADEVRRALQALESPAEVPAPVAEADDEHDEPIILRMFE